MRKIPLKKPTRLEITKSSSEQIVTPNREIKRHNPAFGFVVTHKSANGQIKYESMLERDFSKLLDFSHDVDTFVEQPLTIEFSIDGEIHKYTPDFLAYYKRSAKPSLWDNPVLYEVKPMKSLKKNFAKLKPKFSGAIKYCASKNWRFKVVTERDMPSHFVENAKFLLPYRDQHVDIGLMNNVIDTLNFLKIGSAEEIIVTATRDKIRRAQLLYALWHLVAINWVLCDLNASLTMQTKLRLNKLPGSYVIGEKYEPLFY